MHCFSDERIVQGANFASDTGAVSETLWSLSTRRPASSYFPPLFLAKIIHRCPSLGRDLLSMAKHGKIMMLELISTISQSMRYVIPLRPLDWASLRSFFHFITWPKHTSGSSSIKSSAGKEKSPCSKKETRRGEIVRKTNCRPSDRA